MDPSNWIDPQKSYTRKQLVLLLGVSYNGIKNAVKSGLLKEHNLAKRTYRYLGVNVIAWLEASESRPAPGHLEEKPSRRPDGKPLKHIRITFPTS